MPIVVELTETAQALIFDPEDEGTGTELDVMTAPYGLVSLEAPAPSPEFVWAGNIDTEGESAVAGKHQNRRVSMTVDIVAANVVSRDTAVNALAEKAAKVFARGGTLRLVKQTGDYRTLHLLAADSYEPVVDIAYTLGAAATVSMSFVAEPYARDVEVSVATATGDSRALILTTDTVGGDVPALGRLSVNNNDSGALQKTMVWGLESRYRDSSFPLFWEAEDATILDNAAVATGVITASNGEVARTTTVGTSFASLLRVRDDYRGAYRIIARVLVPATNTGTVTIRGVWASGGAEKSTNAPVDIDPSYEDTWRHVDLGVIRGASAFDGLSTETVGIEAKSTVGADDIDIDWLLFVPVSEGSGRITDTVGIIDSASPSAPSVVLTHEKVETLRAGAMLSGMGRPSIYEGDYLLVPSGVSRMVVMFSRGVMLTDADTNIDTTSAELLATPRFLSLV